MKQEKIQAQSSNEKLAKEIKSLTNENEELTKSIDALTKQIEEMDVKVKEKIKDRVA